MQRTVLIALALTVPGAGGCATAKNIGGADPKPFGGVTMSATDYFGGNGGGKHGGWAASFFWPLWLLDKPFSFAADVATLPYVIDFANRRPQRRPGDNGLSPNQPREEL